MQEVYKKGGHMSLVKVNQSLFPRFSNLWEDFLGNDITDVSNWETKFTVPAVNIVEKPDKFLLNLAIPGMERSDFKIHVDNGILSIASEKEEKHEEQDTDSKFTRREFYYHSFKRSFTLPESVQADKIEATYENGILEISIPKRETAQVKPVKQIPVK